MHQLLSEANIAFGRLATTGCLLPNIDYIIAMYVRKEALLSSQIEGTQASLDDIFEYESDALVSNIQDVEEVVHYIKALNHGLKRLEELSMSIRLIKEIHHLLKHGAWIRHPETLNAHKIGLVLPALLLKILHLFLHRPLKL